MNFKVLIDSERCKGCEYCIEACLHSVLKMSRALNSRGNHFPVSEQAEACTGCKRCVSMCPDLAIRITQAKSKGIKVHPEEKE